VNKSIHALSESIDLPAMTAKGKTAVASRREIKTKPNHVKCVCAATTYTIQVLTGTATGAGTDANVYCVLFGDNGDSGELALKQSSTNKDPFENGQTDVFTFEGVLSLGRLTKCRVWHDNKGRRRA
jgi:hypothetical protein